MLLGLSSRRIIARVHFPVCHNRFDGEAMPSIFLSTATIISITDISLKLGDRAGGGNKRSTNLMKVQSLYDIIGSDF